MTVTLLAYASQGHGDAIQMARYLPELATRCTRLIAMVHGSLVKLFERQARGRWRVMALDAETPEHDAYVDMMSLPFLLGTDDVGKIPTPADFDVPRRVMIYEVYPRDEEPYVELAPPRRIALCTQGGKVASLDLDRSDHTGSLATLTAMPGVEWANFTGRTGDWLDTARELATCDLLISVDSALAHLAGSLGVETWLVPPTHFEWRHLNGVEWSVWYPNMTYYRRTNTRDWPGVTARIRAELERRIAA